MSAAPVAGPRADRGCAEPGCTGQYEDGYCTICGSPQVARAATADTAVDGAPSARASVSVRLPSARLGTARLGSARSTGGSTPTRLLHGTTSARTRAARLGAGLTTVPPAPVADPASVLMVSPQVPESRRFCSSCGAPVGRARDGKPGRQQGFCPQCRAPFSFTPKLTPGTLVGGQYEVAGALAHGGLGWIYLARDRNVSDRWVVLKGLLNSGDADAYAAAVAERQFLARVEHPLIVEIYNFVQHDGAGYIVMEYVGGTSLKEILKDRMQANGGVYDPLPVDQAIAYVLEILPAFSFLHDLGLLYCDFKPDNVIQVGDAVKLIDLGGVRRIDDLDSAIYGTVGYQAPEVATVGPSIASDIYTIGRTLAVLAMEFRGYQTSYVDRLPTPDEQPVLAEFDSFHRLLAKACAPARDDRFQSVEELRGQLLGVLRQVVAAAPGAAAIAEHSVASAHFAAPTAVGDALTWDTLPALTPDPTDPASAWLATVTIADPEARLSELRGAAPVDSAAVRLAAAHAALECGQPQAALDEAARLLDADPWDWRAVWAEGLARLVTGEPRDAVAAFNAVCSQVPGELAPRLALALACELAGDLGIAADLYRVCAATDAGYAAAAAFGLARVAAAGGDRDGALTALDLVPRTSRAYPRARRRRVELLSGTGTGTGTGGTAVSVAPTSGDLDDALTTLAGLSLDAADKALLRASVLRRALQVLTDGAAAAGTVGDVRFTEADVRLALEATLRSAARLVSDRREGIALVDEANRVRPRTLR